MSSNPMLPVAGPSITQLEIDYVTDAVATCWYGDANKYHAKFEEAFASYIGTKFAVSLPSCTSGLHLSLAALGVGSGDEVIVPDITWIATSAPIHYVGATEVFCEVDESTWCLCPDSVEECITDRTKAIIAVDLYGGMPDWHRLQEISDRHGIPIIEDAAESIGSEYRGKPAGSLGITGTFSFHGSKTLTTGEGGMLVTDDETLFERILFLRDHGRPPGDRFFQNAEVAFKYKMSSMQAALGLAQLERVDELVDGKRKIFAMYRERLGDHPHLTLNPEPENTKNSYWMSSVLVSPALDCPKIPLMNRLREDYGVDTRPFFSPLSSIPAYKDREEAKEAKKRNTVSYSIARQGINLPSSLSLTEEECERVVDAFLRCIGEESPNWRNENSCQ